MPIFGRVEALPETLLMYEDALKPEMFTLVSHSIIGPIVWFLRSGSQAVSLGDRLLASLMVGLAARHGTTAGAYPPEGESGKARFTAALGTAGAAGAYSSDACCGRTIVEAGRMSD